MQRDVEYLMYADDQDLTADEQKIKEEAWEDSFYWMNIWSMPVPKREPLKGIYEPLDFYYFSDQPDADSILDTNTPAPVEKPKIEVHEEEESSDEETYDPHGPSKWFILKDGVAPVDESELDEWADDEAY